ncbi:ssDNA-binding domain-containing protein (plasmid) [Pseudonocardia sp. DSM 110487]|uniref:ArdC family protein n=1 Tax=Pseudonocardia sp. DSM 110487 TaxID=2865833 RepID=UPI001C69DF9E|nr:ArdC-like ssDNA-binding domain-containing protein [Pseudonocardia sp. DSM 110487]QYN41013.1 ssDNA-binding domain-containing protein [Pseudonocardia sp. DSM 110487]
MAAKRRGSTKRSDIYATITDQVITQLEAGVAPWHQPWANGLGMPRSMSTGKLYRGGNVMLLAISARVNDYTSPWWGTYRQIAERGGQVRGGEKSTLITFWRTDVETDERTGQERRRVILRTSRVFNAEQADGLALPEPPMPRDNERIAACDEAVAGYLARGPRLRIGGDRAYYNSVRDELALPPRSAFDTSEHYYGALFHELTHSTGHASRLAREGITEGHHFGDPDYSREELIAEMGAAMLAGITGVAAVTLPESAAYLQSWINVLRGDTRLVMKAAAAAQKAADLILDAAAVVAEPDSDVEHARSAA